MKSLSEVAILEQAYECGAPSLGTAAIALKARWDAGLRDQETFVRLAFLCWYSLSEPALYTGLNPSTALPSVDELYSEFGGAANLEPDILFVLGLISHGYAEYCGPEDVWQPRSQELFELATERAPRSAVMSNWQYLLGLADEPVGLRRNIEPELHARFFGRGYMGSYVLHVCTSSRRTSADRR